VKPAGILLCVGSLLLAISLFTKSWISASERRGSTSIGLIRAEACFEDHCEGGFMLGELKHAPGGIVAAAVGGLIAFLVGLGAVGVSATAGGMILGQNRRRFTTLAIGLIATMMLLIIILAAAIPTRGAGFGYSFWLFWVGGAAALTGAIMANMNKAAGAAVAGAPGMYPSGPMSGGYNPYAQPPVQMAPTQPTGQQVQTGPACPACATPATWVAQYNRWFCSRCNQYI
jgi:hypothetical protein